MQQCCIKKFKKKMKLVRNTNAKTEILGLITKSEVAYSQNEIMQLLNGLCDKVTVYRVLERLVEAGQVHKIVNVDGVLKYASCQACEVEHKHDHIHFSCINCKSVTCLDKIEPSFEMPKNYEVHSVNFTVSGLCPQCLENVN